MFSYFALQCSPIMQICWSNIPHVILQDSFRNRTAFICGIRALLFSDLTRCFQSPIVNSLKYLLVK